MRLSVPARQATLAIPSRVATPHLVSYKVPSLLISLLTLLIIHEQHHRLNCLRNPFAIPASPRPAVQTPSVVSRMVKPSAVASRVTSVPRPAAVPSAHRALSAHPAWPVLINDVLIPAPACVPTMPSAQCVITCLVACAHRAMWVIHSPPANLSHVRDESIPDLDTL